MVKTEEIINKNKKLIQQVILYVIRTYNISVIELLSDTKRYTRELLKDIKSNNIKALRLRNKKDKVSQDLDDFNKAFVRGDSYDTTGAGHQKGGLQKNTIEERQLKKQELKETLRELLYEVMELEASLSKTNKMIEAFIDLMPNKDYKEIMKFTYVDCMTNTEIALETYYDANTIDQIRFRSLDLLTDIIKCKAKTTTINC